MKANIKLSNNKNFPFYRVDVFTDKVFSGNPAGVCLINRTVASGTLNAIAAEVNLSETAFIMLRNWESLTSSTTFKLRWFTPKMEVPLCGHATLAAATILFHELGIATPKITFDTLSGPLFASRSNDQTSISLPAYDVSEIEPPLALMEALGISEPLKVLYSQQAKVIVIHLADAEAVSNVWPDFGLLEAAELETEISGVSITASCSAPFDFVSRFFAPWLGINEDPVTGSAHSILAPYWSQLLNKNEMKAFQASRRGGILDIRLTTKDRVDISGDAVIFFRGNIFI
ncbi:PhzF family phenazine biosynthesis protein [candidate division CSSED10-310 bacterium]|uniref:PhzF family phenazine biosynthesis protein n=1 Tax=candidate division CSSED10-310 bacterium TaxID=2855610 RepID=A0ABV6YXU1_UNCC1